MTARRRRSSTPRFSVFLSSLRAIVDRGVERRRAARHGGRDRLLEVGLRTRERRQDVDPAVEVDHLRLVLRPQVLHEPRGGLLGRAHLVFHAGAAVEQQRDRQREARAAEVADLLLDAVFVHQEVVGTRSVMYRFDGSVTVTFNAPGRRRSGTSSPPESAASGPAARRQRHTGGRRPPAPTMRRPRLRAPSAGYGSLGGGPGGNQDSPGLEAGGRTATSVFSGGTSESGLAKVMRYCPSSSSARSSSPV